MGFGVGSGGVQIIMGRVGSGQEIFKSHWSGRVALTRSDAGTSPTAENPR